MYSLDPHIHSCYSPDSLTKIEDIIAKSIDLKLDIIAISDHNTVEGSKVAVELTKNRDDILVIPSIEISSEKGHILGFGCEEKIEEGLVVDLTSIYDNKVTLSVEDKPIARGELVIVNDRYGVKIEEVIAQMPAKTVSSEAPAQQEGFEDEFNESLDENVQQTPAPQAQGEQPASEEDEFDYSDFELEDEDI